ncbi:hypothetical protein D3C80_1766760 [compost metagenome]
MRVVDFIPDAPHEQARMIPVAQHPAFHVNIRPILEKSCVIVSGLGTLPHVERLRDDEKSHLVRQIHKLGSWHIMRRADGVDAHFLQDH